VKFLWFLFVCGAVLLVFAFLVGPRGGWRWRMSLLAGAPLTVHALAGLLGGGPYENPVSVLVGVTALTAVVVVFTGILKEGMDQPSARRSETHPLIPQALLREPWRERRYGLVQRLAAVALTAGAIAVVLILTLGPDDGSDQGGTSTTAPEATP
jgi:hypothetical protein